MKYCIDLDQPWLPIWSRPMLFSVYHLLIIFDHSYLSAIVRFHKIKINLYPACQYPPTLKLSKSSYSHFNYIWTIMLLFFKQKNKSVDCYYCRKITKNCFTLTFDLYCCIWMFLSLIVIFQDYKKIPSDIKGICTLFNV